VVEMGWAEMGFITALKSCKSIRLYYVRYRTGQMAE
jgi:hypothetical protein